MAGSRYAPRDATSRDAARYRSGSLRSYGSVSTNHITSAFSAIISSRSLSVPGDYATGYRTASIAAGSRSTIVAPGYAPGMGYGSPMGTVLKSAVSASGSRSRTDSAFPYAATASGIVYEMGCMPLEQQGVLSTVRLDRSRASE